MENTKTYQVVNGTSYHEETPMEVIHWLETSKQRGQRIRVFYGDTATGRDWLEEHDTMGVVSRSSGDVKIPLIIPRQHSFGGSALLDHCIVRIMTQDGSGKYTEVYRHPKYYQPAFALSITGIYEELRRQGYVSSVYADGENIANFKDADKARRWVAFIKGERHRA